MQKDRRVSKDRQRNMPETTVLNERRDRDKKRKCEDTKDTDVQ